MTVVVTMAHVRKAGICSAGARAWFRTHGLTWSDFVANGIEIERVLAIGCPIANRAADAALKEASDHG